jgi:hypothetical protein
VQQRKGSRHVSEAVRAQIGAYKANAVSAGAKVAKGIVEIDWWSRADSRQLSPLQSAK